MDGQLLSIINLLFLNLLGINGNPAYYDLNDGNKIPAVALGTSLGHLADGTRILSVNHSLANAVQWALEAGYRHIDTASLYRTEDEVGLGIRNFIDKYNMTRSDVYVTTKLWNDAHERGAVVPALRQSAQRLGLDYVDAYLIHYPMAYTKNGEISLVDYLETWQGMEDAKRMNLTRSIGVSNFNITQIKRLYKHATIKPALLQIEVNPTITNVELVEWCKEHDIVVMAYSPFGAILGRKSDAPPPRADHPVLQGLAEKYKKTVPQILLRYLVSKAYGLVTPDISSDLVMLGWQIFGCYIPVMVEIDRGLVAIPRSTNKQRIEQNIAIFDFSLTTEEVERLNAFNSNYMLRTPAKWYSHPEFPFEKKNLTEREIQYIIEHSKED